MTMAHPEARVISICFTANAMWSVERKPSNGSRGIEMGMRERCIEAAGNAISDSRHLPLVEQTQAALDAILTELMQPDIEMLNASLRMPLEDQEMPHMVFEAMLGIVQGKEKQ